MDPNDGNNESVNDGIFGAIAEANHEVYASRGQLDKAQSDPAITGQTGGGTPSKPKAQKTDDEEEAAGDNAEGLDSQDFSRELPEADDVESEAPSQTNTETQTDTPVVEDIDWKSSLPPDPGEFKVERPQPDEYGQLDPVEYSKYLKAEVMHDLKVEAYNEKVITATFETVEKILPEVKDDPGFQAAIRSTFNSTLSGDETIAVAKSLRASIDKRVGAAEAKGAQNAKTSISIQKRSAVETKGATQKKASPTRADNLARRLSKNDTSAFEELMGDWLEDGKI